MAQGAPNVGGVSPTYNILSPHKTIKQQWKKKKVLQWIYAPAI